MNAFGNKHEEKCDNRWVDDENTKTNRNQIVSHWFHSIGFLSLNPFIVSPWLGNWLSLRFFRPIVKYADPTTFKWLEFLLGGKAKTTRFSGYCRSTVSTAGVKSLSAEITNAVSNSSSWTSVSNRTAILTSVIFSSYVFHEALHLLHFCFFSR